MRIGFIGGGVMAESIISGMINNGVMDSSDIMVSEIVPDRRNYLETRYGVNVTSENSGAINNIELIILAVKPQDLSNIYSYIKGSFGPGQSVLSIVAGTNLMDISKGVKHGEIIRIMPNTPAQIGKSMSMWTCTNTVSEFHRATTSRILSSIGDEIYVDDEKYLDMATALSGSGPAYVFLIVEALIDAGVYIGLNRDIARRLVLQTIKGSVELISETQKHPGELKDMVTSPSGTTAAGLQVLEKSGVPAALVDAVNSAYLKSKQLGN